MKVTIERELDVDELFDDMIDNFVDYAACEDAHLTNDDLTSEMLADIFNELAEVAAQRAAKAATERRM